MKYILRTFIFILISVLLTNYLINSFTFGKDYINNLFIVVLSLSLLFIFIRPLLKILFFPTFGPGYWLVSLLLMSLIFYVLTIFLVGFNPRTVTVPSLNLIGFVLPSIHLDSIPALALSSVLIFAFYQGLEWLCPKK